MKKSILFIAIIFTMILAGCSEPTVTKSDLPIEVVNLRDAGKYDTTLCINTNKKVYIFDKKQEYIGKYCKENSDFGLGILAGVLITLILLGVIYGTIND